MTMNGALVILTLSVVGRLLVQLNALDVVDHLGRLVLRDRAVLVAHDGSVSLVRAVATLPVVLLHVDACVAHSVLVRILALLGLIQALVRVVHRHLLVRVRYHLARLYRLRVDVRVVIRAGPCVVLSPLTPVGTDLPRIVLRLIACVGLILFMCDVSRV